MPAAGSACSSVRGVWKKNIVIGTMGCRVSARSSVPTINSAFTGQRITNSIMTNFIYDFVRFLLGWPVTPHIGFGIGAVDNIDSVSLNPVTLNGLGLTTVSGPGGHYSAGSGQARHSRTRL